MFPARVYVGQIIAVFVIFIVAIWGAIQWTAAAMGSDQDVWVCAAKCLDWIDPSCRKTVRYADLTPSSTTGFGSSPAPTMISATSTMRHAGSNHSRTPSFQKCYP